MMRNKYFTAFLFLLFSSLLSSSKVSFAFQLKKYKKCGKSAVLILPEPGIKEEAYTSIIKYFTRLCRDVWILEPQENEDYSIGSYSNGIESALSQIVAGDFFIVVHGLAAIPYVITASHGDYRLRTVFLAPAFFPDDFSPAMRKVILNAEDGKPLCWKKLVSKRIPGFETLKGIPALLFFNDLPLERVRENLPEKYLSCIPSSFLKDLKTWIKEGYINDPVFFHIKKMVAQLNRMKALIITGQRDNVAPYYSVYDHLINLPHLKFILGSRESFMKIEYGHLGILIGRHAEGDIFREIYLWTEYLSQGKPLSENIPF